MEDGLRVSRIHLPLLTFTYEVLLPLLTFTYEVLLPSLTFTYEVLLPSLTFTYEVLLPSLTFTYEVLLTDDFPVLPCSYSPLAVYSPTTLDTPHPSCTSLQLHRLTFASSLPCLLRCVLSLILPSHGISPLRIKLHAALAKHTPLSVSPCTPPPLPTSKATTHRTISARL